uniref:Uncharacterized protein n=1 Tax=Mus spicilegus TaxID=10103 RepID=A0A8C6HS08_MUSSI
MAVVHEMEMESVNLNMERKGKEELEEEKMKGNGEGKDFPRSRKVHKIISKWMLPEPVRRTYLEPTASRRPCSSSSSVWLSWLCLFIMRCGSHRSSGSPWTRGSWKVP